MKLSEMKMSDKALMFLLTGESGSRKTTNALSFPKPIEVADCDDRIESVLKLNLPGSDQINVEKFGPDDLQKFDDWLETFESGKKKVKTLIIDSLYPFCQMSLNFGYKMRQSRPNPGNRDGGPIDLNTMEDYGYESAAVDQLLERLHRIKMKGTHVVMTAHLVAPGGKDEKGNTIAGMARMILTGGKKVAAKLPIHFDEVYCFTVSAIVPSQPQFIVNTVHTGSDFARTSLKLPAQLDISKKPLWSYIEEVLKG